MKRLFLFAAFFSNNTPGASFTYYLKALSSNGDVILMADNDIEEDVLARIKPLTIKAQARRHEEYDFGSYKYCWIWAKENLKLEEYDYVYLVNDSVFGPLSELEPYLVKMENTRCSASCMASFPGKSRPHMQSWFICLKKELFLSPWFDEFMLSVGREEDKRNIYIKYEIGLSELLRKNGVSYSSLFPAPRKSIYNKPLKYFKQGLPFIKKSSFTRHNGSVGYQVRKILEQCPKDVRSIIMTEVEDTLGQEFALRLSGMKRIDSLKSYCKYLSEKLKHLTYG